MPEKFPPHVLKQRILELEKELAGWKHNCEEIRQQKEEISDFARATAHDLKTSIIAIHGLSEKLIYNYGPALDEKGKRYLNHIMNSAWQIQALVNDLHDLVKGEEVTAEPTDISSSDLVKNVINDLQIKAGDKSTILVDKRLPVIQGDKEKIYRVFKNLIENAIKYTDKREDPRIEIGYEERDEFHHFHVSDNGRGIDPAEQAKVFRKYHRSGGTSDVEGSGLGLMIVDRIIRSHGGKVWVNSVKGKGSTFFFTLPKRIETPQPVSLAEETDENKDLEKG